MNLEIKEKKENLFETITTKEFKIKLEETNTLSESSKKSEENCGSVKSPKEQYVCEICKKNFQSGINYQKHLKLYPNNHIYYSCCQKVEVAEKTHNCERKKSEVEDFYDDDDDDKDKSEGENDDNSGQIFQKKKRCKKKLDVDGEKYKIFKCQECLESFEKYSSLSQHNKVVHQRQGKFKCPTCDEDFDTDENYQSHLALHGPEDKVICKGCRRIFDSLKSYYIHAKQNPGVHCYLCKLCLRKFPTELMLEQHVCICQNGKPLHCACGREFTKYTDVIAHSKGTKPFYCCSCPHLSSSLTAYIRHLRKHSKQKPYQCTKCDVKFAVFEFLNIHNKKFHSDDLKKNPEEAVSLEKDKNVCTICNETFETVDELKNHSTQHERVQCPDCGKLLKRNRLENHRNSHKTSASLCPECGKLFDTRFKLTQHLISTHSNEPVKCEVCMKVLKTKKILNEHMKTHLKSEVGSRVPQAICPMCGLGLAQKGSLARHILLTHEKHKIVPCDRTYTCQECSAVLPNRAKYYSHRRMHRAMVDRFPCEICGRVFNKKQNLRRHIYLLHDEKRVLTDPIYKCQICTKSFREKKNLKRHYKMVHKLENIM